MSGALFGAANEVLGQAAARGRRSGRLQLRPIDLDRDGARIIEYAKDLFGISFGGDRFADQFGADGSRYIPWIAEKQLAAPANAALALLAGEPRGMVVVGSWPENPDIGYVYHYYLEPRARGRGLAAQLDSYAEDRLTESGYIEARLSVAETNHRAIRFYANQGWIPAGPRFDQPGILYMQRALAPELPSPGPRNQAETIIGGLPERPSAYPSVLSFSGTAELG